VGVGILRRAKKKEDEEGLRLTGGRSPKENKLRPADKVPSGDGGRKKESNASAFERAGRGDESDRQTAYESKPHHECQQQRGKKIRSEWIKEKSRLVVRGENF